MAVEQAVAAQVVVLVPVGTPGLGAQPEVDQVQAERKLVLALGVSAALVKGKPVTSYSKP
jgi:hypothetical protein